MIEAPLNSPVFYVSFLTKDAATFTAGTLIQDKSVLDDIEACMITSNDFISDIEAFNNLELSEKAVLDSIIHFEKEISTNTEFNPIFLPKQGDLIDLVETNDNGDIISIGGFSSPYIAMNRDITFNDDSIIQSKVIYKEFELPNLYTFVSKNESTVLS